MKRFFTFLLLCCLFFTFDAYQGQALAHCPHPESADDPNYDPHCGIWLCLPGGFPSSCGKQKSAFMHRITAHRKCDPLPNYSKCTGGGELGYEVERKRLSSEEAEARGKPQERNYIKVTIEGQPSYETYY